MKLQNVLVRTDRRQNQDHPVWRQSASLQHKCIICSSQAVGYTQATPGLPLHTQSFISRQSLNRQQALVYVHTGTPSDTQPALSSTLLGTCIDTQSQRLHQNQPMQCEQPEWQLVQQGMRKWQPAHTVVCWRNTAHAHQ